MPIFTLTIPNIITIIRLLLIPLATFPLLPIFGNHTLGILLLVNICFILASVTDFIDGYLARKLNQTSEWGAYMDPLVDKFLIWAMYFVFLFIPLLNVPIWTFVVILSRDLLVTEMRNYTLKHNISFKTSFLAKIKTAIQMIFGGLILIFLLVTYLLNKNHIQPYSYYLEYWISKNYIFQAPSLLIQLISLFTGITGIDYAITFYKKIKQK